MLNYILKVFNSIRTRIQTHPPIGDGTSGANSRFGIVCKLVCYHCIHRNAKIHACHLRLAYQATGNLEAAVLTKRIPDVPSECLDKSKGHAASDKYVVCARHKLLYDQDLITHLRATN